MSLFLMMKLTFYGHQSSATFMALKLSGTKCMVVFKNKPPYYLSV